jgi:hypothetical protein
MPDRKRQYSVRLGFGQAPFLCLFLALGPCVLAGCLTPPPSSETCDDALDPSAIPIAPIALPQPEAVDKRLFGVIPNYRADEFQPVYHPITTAQKFRIARQDSFDWPNFFLLAGTAAQSQVAAGGFEKNGGMEGFAKYYARGFADQIIGAYITEAILPSLLHEDPRYFRLGTGTFRHRSSYAVTRVFVTRLDNGKSGIYLSELAGNAGVIAITSLYYPESQSAAAGAVRYGLNIGNDAVSNMLTEFWPDIKRRLPLHKHPAPSPISAEVLGGTPAGH